MRTFGAVLILVLFFLGCSPSPRYTIVRTSSDFSPAGNTLIEKPAVGTKFRGIASFYSDKYQGNKTASGEIFDMYGLTCAMNILPFNTWLEVRNLANNHTVIVRVNDRGPFVSGRIIDLSLGAAKELGMAGTGIQEVEITVIR